jgi:uncharacterized glyoxalase superfamily protein PhnB
MKPNIVPILNYQNAAAASDWLCHAFQFQRQQRTTPLCWGPGIVALHPREASPDRQLTYVYIPDIEKHHAAAVDAGATIVNRLHATANGFREYSARDLDGHLWSFGTDEMGTFDGDVTFVPDLRCRDLSATMARLENAFGFQRTFEVPGPGGATIHAELRLGTGTIYLSQLPPQHDAWSDLKEFINVIVADPDAHCARATSAGAEIAMPLHDTHFGARGYGARDPEGFLWWFSTYTPAQPG